MRFAQAAFDADVQVALDLAQRADGDPDEASEVPWHSATSSLSDVGGTDAAARFSCLPSPQRSVDGSVSVNQYTSATSGTAARYTRSRVKSFMTTVCQPAGLKGMVPLLTTDYRFGVVVNDARPLG